MKAVIKDNTKILLSKLNSQELAVLENFITKSIDYKANVTKLDNIDGEIDGINFKITDELKAQISYESPYNIVLLPATKAKIDLKVDSDVTVEVINEYEDYLNTSIENNIIEVSLVDIPELKNDCVNYTLGIKLSKDGFNDVNITLIVSCIYSLANVTKLSELENDMGFIDNTVDDLINYYTNIEVNNLLDTKQNILTAGSNISIENGVISAVDTIYDDTVVKADIVALESNKVDKINGKGLSTEDYTTAEKNKLAGLENYDDTEIKGDISDIESDISTIQGDITDLDTNKADKSELPTAVSDLTNDLNFATESYVDTKAVTFKPFPEGFVTTGTTAQFLRSITDLHLNKGMAYLGTVSLSDMPDGIWSNAEVEVYIYKSNVVYCIMRSADVSPYQWECNSYENRGWEPIDKTAKDYADSNFLKKNNTTSYTPSGNYNPATKKYVDDSVSTKQNTLTAGENITITNDTISATDTVYDDTEIQADIALICNDITDLDTNKADKSEITDFITKSVNDLTYYTLATNTGSTIDLEINSSTYVVTLSLKNSAGTVISTDTIDLPLESVVVNGSYDSTNKKIVLTLQSGSTIDIPVADLVSGLQSEITSNNKLSSDLVDDTNNTNKFVTANEKTAWNAKYDLPSGGIPKTDLTSAVQTSLGKADTALQSFTEADPVFSASPAADITSNDITAWNNKSDFSGSYNDLTNKPTIPDELSDLSDDSTHRVVTDTEKTTWNNKYDLPNNGIPKTDLDSNVQTSLGLADTAMQSNVLGRTSDYNTTNKALNLDGLNAGLYYIKIGGSTTYFYIKHDKGSENYSTLRIDLPFSSMIWLFIETKLNAGENPQGTFASYQLNSWDKSYWQLINLDNQGNITLGSSGLTDHNVELNTNKVTSISNQSTDTQYPSAKCVYDNLSGKQDIVQYSTMPNASADTVGKIIQYIGTTTNDYTNGYFYIGVTDGENTPTYSWENLNVQPSSGGTNNVSLYWLNLSAITENQTITDTATLQTLEDMINDFNNGKTVFFENRISLGHPIQNFCIMSGSYTYNNKEHYLWDEISRKLYNDKKVWGYNEFYLKQIEIKYNYTDKKITYSGGYTSNYGRYIDTNESYSNVYTPQYDSSPATKKYVDDTSKITTYQLSGLSEYSSSSTYAVGDYVYYNNLIYKCNTAVVVAEAFDNTKWTQKTYMEYMSEILVGTALQGSY